MFRVRNFVKAVLMSTVVMAALGYAGSVYGQVGLITALLTGAAISVAIYFYADVMALKSMQAKKLGQDDMPELHELVNELAVKADLPMPELYLCPHPEANAFATGRNPKNAKIAVTRGLLKILDENELRGVIGHEMAHVKHYDVLVQAVAAPFVATLDGIGKGLNALSGCRAGETSQLARWVGNITMPLIGAVMRVIVGRGREHAADDFGAALVDNPMYLATALQKIDAVNTEREERLGRAQMEGMFILQPFYSRNSVGWFDSHPSLRSRLVWLIGQPSVQSVNCIY